MYWSISSEEAAKRLETDPINGLSPIEAEKRLKTHGFNRLREGKTNGLLMKFFLQFNDFMILILLAAAAVSLVVSFMNGERDLAEPLIILAIVILNAALGVFQENKAEKSLEALKKLSIPTARVVRDGKVIHIDATEIVPGDIIHLETGDYVPADARILHSVNLKAEESALTGESLPVSKRSEIISTEDVPIGDRRNMLFSGCGITYGRGSALVTATGMDTEVGKIADMIMEHDAPNTPLQRRLAVVGKTLGIAALAICAVIFVLGILRSLAPFHMFMTSVSLAVAAIPEGLPAIVTIMLALGVQRMAKENAIIRKLPAVESLGGATVICSDKTGTLTQNKMRVVERVGNNDALLYASLCSNCEISSEGEPIGDPTEAALINAAIDAGKFGLGSEQFEWRRIDEIPFDPERKMMSTLHVNNEKVYLSITKGAPDVLMTRCTYIIEDGHTVPFTFTKRADITKRLNRMAEKALRVLAVAYVKFDSRPDAIAENDLIFAGLLGMIDPPREEVPEAVRVCQEAGIKPVMITGDHEATARAIARRIGILSKGDLSITGKEIADMDDKQLAEKIKNYSVFARVSPEHKVRIVKAFQQKGEIVAMTGDGVNDAPALKAADIGCAMGINGTEVAKGAADMVLTDDNFATIVKAVREGRGIYANIRKAVHFLLSSNIGEIMTIFVAILMGWQTPLSPIHLLWINLVTDSLPAIALGMDPAEEGIMTRKPINPKTGLFAGGLWYRIAAEGLMIGFLALCAFGIGAVWFGSHNTGITMCFATLSVSQLVHAFNMRSEESIFKIDLLGNVYLVGALIIGIIMQVAVINIPRLYEIFKVTPLGGQEWTIVAILCLMPVFVVEAQKYLDYVLQKRKSLEIATLK
ncbi:MAG: calcium-translocating P-type ATPase, PMCA-type [Clostridiales bacterium]|jgi:Ca2+-transporting ATPase|nr:calcium-translocating P-type ATPase, PMCA-type [Clostridiales bacterium]